MREVLKQLQELTLQFLSIRDHSMYKTHSVLSSLTTSNKQDMSQISSGYWMSLPNCILLEMFWLSWNEKGLKHSLETRWKLFSSKIEAFLENELQGFFLS